MRTAAQPPACARCAVHERMQSLCCARVCARPTHARAPELHLTRGEERRNGGQMYTKSREVQNFHRFGQDIRAAAGMGNGIKFALRRAASPAGRCSSSPTITYSYCSASPAGKLHVRGSDSALVGPKDSCNQKAKRTPQSTAVLQDTASLETCAAISICLVNDKPRKRRPHTAHRLGSPDAT